MKQSNKMRLGAAICSVLIASAVGGYAQGELADLEEARMASASIAAGADAPAQMLAMSAETQAAREAYEQAVRDALQKLVEAGILSQAEVDAFTSMDAQEPRAQGRETRRQGDGNSAGGRGQGQPPQGRPGGNGAPNGNSAGGRTSAWSGLVTQEKLATLTAEQQAVWAAVEQQLSAAETALMEALQKLRPAP